jgi:hypothetical protein
MRILKPCLILSALVGALFFTGCATITRGTTEQLKIESIPAAAQVRLDTGETGVTPASFTVPRKRDITVTITKEGYLPVTRTVTTKMAGKGAAGLAGNVLIGGVIGLGVDAISGATLNHTPNPLVVTLESVNQPVVAPAEPKAAEPVVEPPPAAPVVQAAAVAEPEKVENPDPAAPTAAGGGAAEGK